MALTLPYPDMDFVPLDILTAAEQDQLVANIEYISNQFPIASANIGTAEVKAANIDFSTIATYMKVIFTGKMASNAAINAGAIIPLAEESHIGAGNIEINSSGQFKIGSGINRILCFASWTGSPEASGFRRVHIRKNGTLTDGYSFTTTDVASGYINGSISGMILSVSQNDLVDLYNRDTKFTFWTGTRMTVIGFQV